MPCPVPEMMHRAQISQHGTESVHMFHNVLKVFHYVIRVFHNVLRVFYDALQMFENI